MGPMTQLWRSRVAVPGTLSLLLALLPVGALSTFFSLAARADSFQSDDGANLFDKSKAAVVQVRSGDKGFILAGTGFFIDDQGTVLTSSTILGENHSARVLINGVEVDAKIIGNDPRSGLAMLKVSYDESPSLSFGHTGDLKSGDMVITIGYPLNLPVAPSQGPVSGFDTSYLTRLDGDKAQPGSVAAVERFATTHIHANVAISPGEVGGPLLNTRGEVVGLVATSPDNGRSIYALPVEAMGKIMADFNQYGRARHGWVGVNVAQEADTNHDGRTVRVVRVVAGTPASESGIEPGDTVMRIDAREIYRPSDVLDASFFSHVGGNMTVVVRREEKLYNYTFAVIERPEHPEAAERQETSNSNPQGHAILVKQTTSNPR